MKADSKTAAEVMAALNKLIEAYGHRDIDSLLAGFVKDPDLVMFGTGADEKRIGLAEVKAQAERDWSQTDAASFQWGWHSVSAAGPVAWLAAEGSVKAEAGGQEMSLPVRLTAVLEQRVGRWLLAQAHFSFPAAEQAEGESFPT